MTTCLCPESRQGKTGRNTSLQVPDPRIASRSRDKNTPHGVVVLTGAMVLCLSQGTVFQPRATFSAHAKPSSRQTDMLTIGIRADYSPGEPFRALSERSASQSLVVCQGLGGLEIIKHYSGMAARVESGLSNCVHT